MKTRVLALLLVLVSPALFAAPERVADVLKDMQAHGYTSPTAAMARLQSAQDAQDTHAPLEQRRRYYAALIALALPNKDEHLRQQAMDALQALAQQQHCASCRAQWLLGKAQAETTARRLLQARAALTEAEALIPVSDRAMRLQLALVQMRFERAQGTLNMAYQRASEAQELADQLGDKAAHIDASTVLAVLNAQLGYLDRAESGLRDAAAQAHAIGYTAALAVARLDEGYIYSRRHQRAREAQALQQALAIADGVPGLAYIEVTARANLSDYYLERGDYAATLREAQQAADLAHATHDLGDEAIALSNLGIAQAHLGRVDEGVQTLRKAMELAHRTNDLFSEADMNRELVKVLESAGRYKQALLAMQAFDATNARITQQVRDNAVLELQAKRDDERKNLQIEQLSTQAKIKEAEAAARRWQQRLWTMLAGVAVLSALLLVLRLSRARRANRKLTRDVANLTEQSSLDELTGAFNRRHFASLMQQYADAPDARVGLVMLDIDHFKSINDEFGHTVGDAVLKEAVRRLRALGRGHDHVVRWGGEEFVLVLPDAPPRYLPALAERLLDTMASQPFHLDRNRIHATISIGCIAHPLVVGGSPENAMRLADQALYMAKRHGRNRAICVLKADGVTAHQLAGLELAAGIEQGLIATAEIAGPGTMRTEQLA